MLDLRELRKVLEAHAENPGQQTYEAVRIAASGVGSEFLKVLDDRVAIFMSYDSEYYATPEGVFRQFSDGEVWSNPESCPVLKFLEALTDYYQEGDYVL